MPAKSFQDVGAVQRPASPTTPNLSDADVGAVQHEDAAPTPPAVFTDHLCLEGMA